ncbi:hypothetical protein L6Q79_11715 [bacterium]|nr:hypothetical protein [bacterium]NUN46326.1 hypothetical protein [bacterium]
MHFEYSDLVTIGLLVLLEGLLSADNAIVLAVQVLPLPPDEQKKALRYGIIGAFVFRIIAVLLASYLINMPVVKIIGGIYLCWLALDHFRKHGEDQTQRTPKAKQFFGLSAFWSTVIAVELTDIVFSVDSILAAVALSNKQWVVVTGGIIGIITMRMVAGVFLQVIKKYPRLVDGAYIIVFLIGAKLFAEYFNMHVSKIVLFGTIFLIMIISILWSNMDKKKQINH